MTTKVSEMNETEKQQYLQTQAKALSIIIGAVRLAQKRGAFSLEEASQIAPAVNLFAPPQQDNPENQQDNPENPEAQA